jgi:hypothetical protein
VIPKLNLAELLERTDDWSNFNWGAKASQEFKSLRKLTHIDSQSGSGFREVHYWNLVKTGPDQQLFGSCIYAAHLNILAVHVFATHKEPVQFDFEKAYWQHRKDIGNMADEGANMPDAHKLFVRHDIIPPDSKYHRCAATVESICTMMAERGPIAIAESVHRGYRATNIAPNGLVATSAEMTYGLIPYTQGHCMMVGGIHKLDDLEIAGVPQTWGRLAKVGEDGSTRPPYHGICFIPIRHLLDWMIDFPGAFDLGPDWPKWTGWRKWLVNREV